MENQSWLGKGRSPGAARFALIPAFALGIVMLHYASTTFSGTHNRITSISPLCASPGERVTLKGFGLGAANIVVTVAGIRARVMHATGHMATFIVPASAPDGPTIVEVSHKVGGHRGWPGKKVIGSIAFQVGCDQANQPPVARAGTDQEVTVGAPVTLDGRNSSDPDGDLIAYLWSIVGAPAGSIAALDSATSVTPVLSPDLPGTYRIALVVNDGELDSLPDEVLIQAAPPNVPPTANAGTDQSVVTRSLVNLDGTGSLDPDGDPLTYAWLILSKPDGSNAALNDPASPTPSFPADQDGQYLIQLVVHDGEANSSPDDVVVIAASSNAPPIADAGGDQTVARNATIQLDGSHSSDPNGDPLSHSWSVVSRPASSASPFNDANTATPSLFADRGGEYVFRLVVNDGQVDSTPDTVLVTVVNDSPVANAGPDQAVAPGALVTLDGSGSTDPNGDSLTYFWSIVSSPAGSAAALNLPASIHPTITPDLPGVYSISLTVSDGQATSSPDTVDITASVPTVVVPDVVGLAQADAETAIVAAGLSVGGVTTANSETVSAGNVISQSPVGGSSVAPGTTVSLVVSLGPSGGGLPPDPGSVAPPVDQTVATVIGPSTEFLYTGANPIQTGVAPGTIELKRAAVIRGKVLGRDNQPLSGVAVSILSHPEFGQTVSRADGMFDLAVNGGGLLTVHYQREGFLTVQRQGEIPWQDFVAIPDVVLVPLDPQVTAIDLSAPVPMQVVQGSPVTDADGTRRATILFPEGTAASMTLPDGSTQPLTTLHVRATEYTVGENGPQAMPAALPDSSAYTYCAELSVDEAIAQGATGVQFSQPVFTYVDNFIGFPIGGLVPVGIYDRQTAKWVPSPDGRVIRVLSITAGLADVDTDGDGTADDGAAIGLTAPERERLASLYAAGQSLWRIPLTHFSPMDANWPYELPGDARTPGLSGASAYADPSLDGSCEVEGSIIECENRVLGETVALAGAPYSLHYRSDRVPGGLKALHVELGGPSLPASLQGIRVRFSVAGRYQEQTFPPSPGQKTQFLWDGLDVYGRPLLGAHKVTGAIDYGYFTRYRGVPGSLGTGALAFGQYGVDFEVGSGPVIAGRGTFALSMPISARLNAGLGDARGLGLGGWTLDVHHFYDPVSRTLYRGDGGSQRAENLATVIETVLTSTSVSNANFSPSQLKVAPDGSLYVTSDSNGRVYRLTANGTVTIFAGGGSTVGDGGPATSANIGLPWGVALGPDGSVYIASGWSSTGPYNRIRRVYPDGTITTVAGTETGGFSGDGGPATEAQLFNPRGIAVAADGTVFIADQGNQRIRRVSPDGIITTIAGNGTLGFSGDGGPASEATFRDPFGITLGPDGALYIADEFNHRIRRIGPDGIITTVAGNGAGVGTGGFEGDGGPATSASLNDPFDVAFSPDGTMYIADLLNSRIRGVRTDGMIYTVAGTGQLSFSGDGGPAATAAMNRPRGVTVAPDGTIYLADNTNRRVRRVRPALPGLTGQQYLVASSDGNQLYAFDPFGRHLRTLNALTGATLLEFTYDTEGRLIAVIEKTGGIDKVTTIERNPAGAPTALVGPFGHRTALTVNADGFLASITNPAGEPVSMTYTPGGLLTRLADARGSASSFTYDAEGRLARDQDAAGGFQQLASSVSPDQSTITRTTALGRTTTYAVEKLPGNIQRRTVTEADGTVSVSEEIIDAAKRTVTAADGTQETRTEGPDPRFGMQAPLRASASLQLPGGPLLTGSETQTAVLSNPADLLSLASLTRNVTVAGRTRTSTYTAATRTQVSTSPAGRTRTVTLDSLGRPLTVQSSGTNPASLAYDARGRLTHLTLGSGTEARELAFAYGPDGLLDTVADPLGRTVNYDYDTAGRLTGKTLAGGSSVAFAYDSAGDLLSITPPGRPPYIFSYDARGLVASLTPPAIPGSGATNFEHNLDRSLVTFSRPGSETVSFAYDGAGRPGGIALADSGGAQADYALTYNASGLLGSIDGPGGQSLSYGYTGFLIAGVTWGGPVSGTVNRTFDNALRTASESVNGAHTVSFSYDPDDLLIGAGGLSISRDAQSGRPTSTVLGAVSDAWTYNGFGEVASYTASASGAGFFEASCERDAIGRIVRKVETIGGTTTTFEYAYDTLGQLTQVTRDGVVVELYGYDERGSRISATVGGATASATYDDQERLLTYGSAVYEHTPAGRLLRRTAPGGTTEYVHDALGNLLRATLPSGTVVSYLLDGADRRVGRNVNGVPGERFLYADRRPVAQLDDTGAVVSRFVYAGSHVPITMVKGGATFRIITDPSGSVRLVVDAATGVIAQRLDYDSFGRIHLDTSPGFQPFGFAGGIHDGATGLVRFGLRDYDPETGRFISADPAGFAGGDANLYRYVFNDPVNLRDPSGLGLGSTLAGIAAGLYDFVVFQQFGLHPHITIPEQYDPNPIVSMRNFTSLFTDQPEVQTSEEEFKEARKCTRIGAGLTTAVAGVAGAIRNLVFRRATALAEAELAALQARNAARLAEARAGQVDFAKLQAAAAERRVAAEAEKMAERAKAQAGEYLQNLESSGSSTPTGGGYKPGGGY